MIWYCVNRGNDAELLSHHQTFLGDTFGQLPNGGAIGKKDTDVNHPDNLGWILSDQSVDVVRPLFMDYHCQVCRMTGEATKNLCALDGNTPILCIGFSDGKVHLRKRTAHCGLAAALTMWMRDGAAEHSWSMKLTGSLRWLMEGIRFLAPVQAASALLALGDAVAADAGEPQPDEEEQPHEDDEEVQPAEDDEEVQPAYIETTRRFAVAKSSGSKRALMQSVAKAKAGSEAPRGSKMVARMNDAKDAKVKAEWDRYYDDSSLQSWGKASDKEFKEEENDDWGTSASSSYHGPTLKTLKKQRFCHSSMKYEESH